MRLKTQHPNLKILLSVGGGGGSQNFAQLAAQKDSRVRFASSARDFCNKYGFDGIDCKFLCASSSSLTSDSCDTVDWEHPSNPEQGSDFVKLLRALRQSLPHHVLTTALPAGEWCLRNIDVKEASHILNFINVMCYDFSGSWTEMSGHQAQLYAPKSPHNAFAKRSGHSAMTYFLSKGVDSRKLVLGIPAYGRSFLGVDGIGQKFTGHGGEAGGTLEYKTLPQTDAQEFVDHNVVAAYCLGGDAGFVSYDTPETVVIKAQYVKRMNLAGLFYWTGVSDVEIGPRSLIQAGFDALR